MINGKNGPRFVPGQVIETEDGNEQFIPGQIMDTKDGKKFVPGQIIETKSGPNFIPGQVIRTDDVMFMLNLGRISYSLLILLNL